MPLQLGVQSQFNFPDSSQLTFAQACRVFLSSAQSIPPNVDTKVLYDSERYNLGGNFSLVNSEWTCPSSGYYSIKACTKIVTGLIVGKRLELKIKIDALPHHAVYVEGSSHTAPSVNVFDTVYLTTGQKIVIHVKHNDTGNQRSLAVTDENTYLIIRKIGS